MKNIFYLKQLNWRYYLPFLIFFLSATTLFHFIWLPNYLETEKSQILAQEKKYLTLLSTTLLPSVITGDLAEIHETLRQVINTRNSVKNIELFDGENHQVFPFNSNKVPDEQNLVTVSEELKISESVYGRLVSSIDLEELMKDRLQGIRNLEQVFLLMFVLVCAIGVYFQIRWVRNPIKTLVHATADVAAGNYSTRLPGNQTGDFREFVVAFDQMREILKNKESRINRQQEVQAAVRNIQSYFLGNSDAYSIHNNALNLVLELTSSAFGFMGEINYDKDGNPFLKTYALSNVSWDVQSRKLYENSLKEGLVFDNLNTLFGSVMVTGKPVITNTPKDDERSGGVPEGHPPLNNFMGVPLYNRQNVLTGMVALANCKNGVSFELYEELSILWSAIGNLIDAHREQLLLSESEENVKAILNNAADGIITIDQTGIIETFNLAAEKIFGYRREEVVGKNIKMLMPEEYANSHDNYLANYLKSGVEQPVGRSREVLGLRKNKEIFPLELSIADVITANARKFTGIVKDITERKQFEQDLVEARVSLSMANAKLEELVIKDSLTGISNRRHFDTILEAELRRATRTKTFVSLILFDIDFFKKYNDHYGHTLGDDCIKRVANVAATMFKRAGDLIARYGGEEFAIILPSTDEVAGRLAENLVKKVAAEEMPHKKSLVSDYVTISAGVITLVPNPATKSLDVINLADEALYKAKNRGRNCAVAKNIQFPSGDLDAIVAQNV